MNGISKSAPGVCQEWESISMSIRTIIENIKSKGLLQAMGLLDQLYQKAIENEEKLAAAEAKCAALAAENAALKQFPEQIIGFVGRLGTSEIGSSTREAIESAAKRIKTPATDAYLAEVRAQGVEMFAREMHADISEADAIEFAAKLRQGGAE